VPRACLRGTKRLPEAGAPRANVETLAMPWRAFTSQPAAQFTRSRLRQFMRSRLAQFDAAAGWACHAQPAAQSHAQPALFRDTYHVGLPLAFKFVTMLMVFQDLEYTLVWDQVHPLTNLGT